MRMEFARRFPRPLGQPKEILVLFPLLVRYFFLQSFKAIFVWPSRRFRQTLLSADAPCSLPVQQRRPPHSVGLRLWL